jgi:hypothetical protein
VCEERLSTVLFGLVGIFWVFFFFFLAVMWFDFEAFVLARQVLSYLSCAPSPFFSGYF